MIYCKVSLQVTKWWMVIQQTNISVFVFLVTIMFFSMAALINKCSESVTGIFRLLIIWVMFVSPFRQDFLMLWTIDKKSRFFSRSSDQILPASSRHSDPIASLPCNMSPSSLNIARKARLKRKPSSAVIPTRIACRISSSSTVLK